ncbi:MAG: GatB/YqeY domain-containing protein [Acidobacteria bacterium]|nr:GatB/YqeY domain-containing protein [Acidobacteriota bacterium]NIM61864.1 GatB/YqeY domain-containing protein [Acidobacteriota bacterium]NIO60821.1 GatB/YqeY domain-containing protein [Acidobacteriota bacterium]NIQ31896.1 GatB/YqeY domain-containing protein [Acidobacteriota bacterium]NIQ87273.1 GatB/YqeY domain-containing protein [Acidobacteriota bacterium]
MALRQRIEDDLKTALKSGDKRRLSCLRMVKSKVQEKQVELRAKKGADAQLSDEDVQAVVSAYAKQRRDSIESYEQGGREDLAAAERAELEILTTYLPQQLSEDDVAAIVDEAVKESGASQPKDMGAVMKLVMPKVKGRADGKLVNRLVQSRLKG